MKSQNFTTIKEISYKGRVISLVEDDFNQEFAVIDEDTSMMYVSISDAKRVINGLPPKYELI